MNLPDINVKKSYYKLHFTILTLSMIVSFTSKAQEVGSWWMYYGLNRVHDNWSIWTEAQYRSHDNGKNIEQLLLRTAVNYHISNSSLLSLGYGYISSYVLETDINAPTIEEGRIFEQFIQKHTISRIFFEHRIRIEQRWAQNIYKNRFRYRLFLTVPLNNKQIDVDTWFLGIYDELFLNSTKEYFDRNRLYFALGYQLDKNVNIQSGMMTQRVEGGSKWYFQFALTWNTDFRN